MPIPVAGVVGPATLQDGSNALVRQDRAGAIVASIGHGELYEAAFRSNVFLAGVAAATFSSAAVSCTGLMLINPSANTKNAAIYKVTLGNTATGTTAVAAWLCITPQALTTGTMTTATAATVYNGKLGSGTNTVGCYTSINAFTAAPVAAWPLAHITAAIATTGEDLLLTDFQGGLILPPGYAIAIACLPTTATATTLNAGIMWEEVPV